MIGAWRPPVNNGGCTLSLLALTCHIFTLTGLLGSASADSPAAEDPKATVQVTVVTILATDQNEQVDPKLKWVARVVKKSEPQLTGFRLARTTQIALPVGGQHKFPLVEHEVAEVTVQQGTEAQNKVSLKVKAPQMGEIVYSTACGKFFPIVTRYQTKDKERLIVAVMVGSCKHPKRVKPDK
jgi:hypothetical protein